MAKVLTTQEQEAITTLLSSYDMLKKSREAVEKQGNAKRLADLDNAINDVISQVATIDPERADSLKKNGTLEIPKKKVQNLFDTDEDEMFSILSNQIDTNIPSNTISLDDIIASDNTDNVEEEKQAETIQEESQITEKNVEAQSSMFNNIDPSMQYDIIELPSNGQTYPSKIDRLPIGYLTAYDENFITSPNLYKDGLVIDFLVKNKVLTKEFNVEDLVTGDVDAITLWLRATSYGYDFPVTVTDPQSGEPIETVVDLSTLKPKEFTLIGDENGYFDYTLPLTKKVVKFRYLTRKQEKQLKRITELEGYGTKASLLEQEARTLSASLVGDKLVNDTERKNIQKAVKDLGEWAKRLKKKQDIAYNRLITNILQMEVVAIDGITDRDKVKELINNIPAGDSLALRRYINDNQPGINFEVEIQRPERLGGGSFKTFLNWDDTVFINIPKL